MFCNQLTFILYVSPAHSFICRAGSDGSMSASGSVVRGSIPGRVVNFHLKIFNLGTKRGGDVYFLITKLYITVLD